MIKTGHISQDELLELLGGDGESEKTRLIGAHLHQCEDCRQALDELTARSAIWKKTPDLLKSAWPVTGAHPPATADRPAGTPCQYPIDGLLEPPRHPEMMGRIGNYDIEREVGRGGMGVVLKAHDAELNRPLAIKILAPHLASHAAARQRFAQEARAAAGVLHPNVIAVHGVNNQGQTPYLVMPYVPGPSLQTLVDQQGPLPEIEIVRIALQISAGLAAAHSQGLVHRDIKPANILVEEGVNRVLITDFGLARAEDDASLTRSGWLTGTPNYMSPEQTRGERPDPRSDLFSLGSLIYFLATGRLPFRSESPLGVLTRIQNDEPTAVRQVNPQVSKTLADVIGLLLKKEPASRFQTAAALHELLERHLAYLHQPDISKPPVVRGAETSPGGPHLLKTLVAVAVLACLAMLVPGYFGTTTPDGFQESVSAREPASATASQDGASESSPAASANADSRQDVPAGAGSSRWAKSTLKISGGVGPFFPGLNRMQDLEGDWQGEIRDGILHLKVVHAFSESCHWVHSDRCPLDDFVPPVTRDVTKFELKRKFGTLHLEGGFSGDKGKGSFHFAGDDTYRQQLKDRGLAEAPDGLLIRLFFGMDEKKFLDNMQALQKLGLEEEILQPLMLEGVPAQLVRDYQEADLPVAKYLRFVSARVGADLIRRYQKAGLDPEAHKEFVVRRVGPELLLAYREAGLDLVEYQDFINSRVQPQQLKEYQAAGLDITQYKVFLRGRVSPALLQSYTDAGYDPFEFRELVQHRVKPELIAEYEAAGLDIAEHKTFIRMRVTPALLQSYDDAGYDVEEYRYYIQRWIKPEFLKAYDEAGLPLEEYRDFIQGRVSADFLLSYRKAGYDPFRFRDLIRHRVSPELIGAYEAAGLDIAEHKDFIKKRVPPGDVRKYRDRQSKKQ